MPDSIQIGLLVLGAVLLVVALTQGGVKIFNAEVSASTGKSARMLSGALGLLFVLLAVVLPLLPGKQAAPNPQPEPVNPEPAPSPAPTPQPAPTPVPAPSPTPTPEQSGPRLNLTWRVLNAFEGAAVFGELDASAQQKAQMVAYAVLQSGQDIYAVDLQVHNDGSGSAHFDPNQVQLGLEGVFTQPLVVEHPRRLKAQRLAANQHIQGLVFVRCNALLGAALQLGQGELRYQDGSVSVSSNHR